MRGINSAGNNGAIAAVPDSPRSVSVATANVTSASKWASVDSPMPIGERPGSFEGQREWRSVGAPQQTVYQNAGGFVRFELEP
jgi:hypothetical protein